MGTGTVGRALLPLATVMWFRQQKEGEKMIGGIGFQLVLSWLIATLWMAANVERLARLLHNSF
jgi:hypothetical protein